MNTTFVLRAREYAIAAHTAVGQKRKYTNDPYYVHPLAVMQLVESVTSDYEILAAALLHDVVEDTHVTVSDIAFSFGPRVADLVGWVSDVSKPSDGNRKKRKELDRDHLAKAPGDAQTIKLADIIDNARTILQHDPDFAEVWIDEKRELLDVMKLGHPILYGRAHELVWSIPSIVK